MDRIDKLKDYLKQSPHDSFLQHALALEYVKMGKDSDARALFEEILSREPGYIGSYYQLGRLLERVGDRAAAIDCFQLGMEMAMKIENRRAYQELQSAWDELTGD